VNTIAAHLGALCDQRNRREARSLLILSHFVRVWQRRGGARRVVFDQLV